MRGQLGDNAAPMHGKLLKGLSAIVIILALAFPFLLALEKISESDTFWHLKTGEWIIAHGAVPRVDPFSATVVGKQWLDWEWLFQVARACSAMRTAESAFSNENSGPPNKATC